MKKLDLSIDDMSVPSTNSLDALLALRGIACIMVVIYHAVPVRKAIIYGDIDLSWIWFSHGSVAVWIFFCMSGYLMGKAFYTTRYSITPKGVIDFWRNRALRILPPYYFAVFMQSVLVYPDILRLENWGSLIRIITFTYPGYLRDGTAFNETFWSLSTEVQFYIIVPFIYSACRFSMRKIGSVLTAMAFSILFIFSIKLLFLIPMRSELNNDVSSIFQYWYAPLIVNLDVFLIGFLVNPLILAYRQRQFNGASSEKRLLYRSFNSIFFAPTIAVALMVFLYAITSHHIYTQELLFLPGRSNGFRTITTFFIFQPLTAVTTAFFIWVFETRGQDRHSKPLSFASIIESPVRSVEVLGNLSYGVYLWHLPIYSKVAPLVNSKISFDSFITRLSITLFLSFIMASLVSCLIERPTKSLKIHSHSN
jgi:peptidoglycan/LPS O-acetylase OafA/YrhL